MGFPEKDWWFFRLEERGASETALSPESWAAADHAVKVTLRHLRLKAGDRIVLRTLFTVVLDRKAWADTGRVPKTLGALGTELRHAVDLARLYSDDFSEHASLVARAVYRAASLGSQDSADNVEQ
mgnify:CR=1 FL=1